MPDDKLTSLWTNLRKKNSGFTVSLDQFKADMAVDKNRSSLHSNMPKYFPGFNLSYEEFSSDMGYGGTRDEFNVDVSTKTSPQPKPSVQPSMVVNKPITATPSMVPQTAWGTPAQVKEQPITQGAPLRMLSEKEFSEAEPERVSDAKELMGSGPKITGTPIPTEVLPPESKEGYPEFKEEYIQKDERDAAAPDEADDTKGLRYTQVQEWGRELQGRGDLVESNKAYESASMRDPNDPNNSMQIGYNYMVAGDYQKSLQNLDKSIYLAEAIAPEGTDQGNPDAYSLRSYVNSQLKNYDQAVSDASRAVELRGYRKEGDYMHQKDEGVYYDIAKDAQRGMYAAQQAGDNEAYRRFADLAGESTDFGNKIQGSKNTELIRQYVASGEFTNDIVRQIPILRNILALKEGIDEAEKTYREEGVSGKLANDIITTAFPVLLAAAPGAEILLYTAEKVLPQEVMSYSLAPLESLYKAGLIETKISEEGMRSLDIIGSLLILHAVNKAGTGTYDKVTKTFTKTMKSVRESTTMAKISGKLFRREPLTKEEFKDVQEIVDNASVEEIKAAAEIDGKIKSAQEKDVIPTDVEAKKDVLNTDLDKASEKPTAELPEGQRPIEKPVIEPKIEDAESVEQTKPVEEVKQDADGVKDSAKETSPETEVKPEIPAEDVKTVLGDEGQIQEGVNAPDVSTAKGGNDLQRNAPEKIGGEAEQIDLDIEKSKTEPVVGLLDRIENVSDAKERKALKKRLSDANTERARTTVQKIKEAEKKEEKTPEDEQLVENSIIPIDKDIKERVASFAKRWLKPGGNMPRSGHTVERASAGRRASELWDVSRSVNKLHKTAKMELGRKFRGKKIIPDGELRTINEAINGDVSALNVLKQTAPETAARVIDLSNARTKFQKVIEQYVGKNMAEIIMNSEGVYTTRSYRLFLSPKKWNKFMKSKEGDVIRQNAETAIRNIYSNKGITLTDAEVTGEINKILKSPDRKVDRSSGKTSASIDLSSLMHRKKIPIEIRELMGEVKNPFLNYYITLTKLANMAESMKFIDQFARAGKDEWLFDRPVGDFDTPLYSKESLQGRIMGKEVYTTSDIKQAFDDLGGIKTNSLILKSLIAFNSIPKFMMTLANYPGIVRNFTSSLMINMANGRLSPSAMKRGAELMVADMKSESSFDGILKMLYEKGILGESVKLGDIKSYAEDFMSGSSEWDRFYDGVVAKSFGKTMDVMKRAWSVGDDINRIIGFFGELDKLKSAYKGTKTIEELHNIAAEKIMLTTPTYSRTPLIVSAIKKIPVIGPFPSWTAEIIRVSGNTLALAVKEMKNPKERTIGITRMASFIAVNAIPIAIKEVSQHYNGTDDNDIERYRALLPDYAKNNQIIPMTASGGSLDYINMSFVDPYSMWKGIATAAARSGDVNGAMIDGVHEMIRPFISAEIGSQILLDLRANKNSSSGQEIYYESGNAGDIMVDVLNYVWEKGLKPGTWKAAEKIGQAGRVPSREIANTFFGIRVQSIDVKKSIMSDTKRYINDVNTARRAYNKVRYNPTATTEERLAALEKANSIYKNLFDEFKPKVDAAVYYLGDQGFVRKMMDESGMTADNSLDIILGNFNEFEDKPIYDDAGNKIKAESKPEKRKKNSSRGRSGNSRGGVSRGRER